MAEWKQTLEPYIKVQERVMTAALNPTVGEDLIVGVAFISDAGPSTPTLITSQKEFLSTYASGEITKEYLAELDGMYDSSASGLSNLASSMWMNAYRLAGSTGLLCVRAAKADNIFYAKPLNIDGGNYEFVLKDGELLKLIENIRLAIDKTGDEAVDHNDEGWSINVRGVGRFGNRITDLGVQYDYYAGSISELVEKLNETSKFFATEYEFEKKNLRTGGWDKVTDPSQATSVLLKKVYMANTFLEEDLETWTDEESGVETTDKALWYIHFYQQDGSWQNPNQSRIDDDINTKEAYTLFGESEALALNTYNSTSAIKVRIRRFNHDAVVSKTISAQTNLTEKSASPWTVLPDVLKVYSAEQTDYIKSRDFFEIAVLDPGNSSTVSFFNIGHIPGRGDIEEVSELNDLLSMLSLELPEDLHDLGLNYFDYTPDDGAWKESDDEGSAIEPDYYISDESELAELPTDKGLIASQIDGNVEWKKAKVVINKKLSDIPAAEVTDEQMGSAFACNDFPQDLDSDYIGKVYVKTNYSYYKVELDAEEAKSISSCEVPENLSKVLTVNYIPNDLSEYAADTIFRSPLKCYEVKLMENSEDKTTIALPYPKLEYAAVAIDVPEVSSETDLSDFSVGTILVVADRTYKVVEKDGDAVCSWEDYDAVYPMAGAQRFTEVQDLPSENEDGKIILIAADDSIIKTWKFSDNGPKQIFADLTCPNDILKIGDSDLLRAIDKIQENEVYIVEGLCDLGNTNPAFQSYLCNLADSEDGNYFYPISTINSSNYMTISNAAAKLSKDSYKLYLSAPWDIDSSTLGIRFDAAPSVIFWEGVAQNYRAGRPYASLFGQTYGKVSYQRPVCEFNKKQRQLLLTKKVNTVMWNTNSQIWQMNDNYTKQSENTIMNDEGNVRMGIHIAKVQNQLLAQFIGKKITPRLCADVRSIEEYWINTNIMSLDGNRPEAFQVFCEYDAELARQNKIKVVINIRFSRALKYVNVLNRYFDTGMDISSDV